MPWISDEEYKDLKAKDWDRCPNCNSTNTTPTSFPDFRFSNSGHYTVQCNNCGHTFGNTSRTTG